jgi:proteasome-associated ATPase
MDPEKLVEMLLGEKLDPEGEGEALQHLANARPAALFALCRKLAQERRRLRGELAVASQRSAEAQALLAQLMEPPLHPGTVIRKRSDGRVEVAAGGRRLVVGVLPELAQQDFAPGREVLLNSGTTAIVAHPELQQPTGQVGTVSELADGIVLVRGLGDEEVGAFAAPEVAASLVPGDRVLYTREVPCVLARLPKRSQSPFALLERPRLDFAGIGGLDALIEELRGDLDLFVLHRERLSAYRIELPRGVLLVGPPGTGKTLLAEAIAGYIGSLGVEAGFLNVKPGALRGSYYGESEARIRDLFAAARAAPGLVVLFFDEVESFGTRSGAPGQEIDSRVLAALLAEINGLGDSGQVLCIGATNRLDLCDEALVRPRRLGDRIYRVPRPGREATRQILALSLTPDLPWAGIDAVSAVEAATSHLFAPSGGAGALATLTFAGGEQQEVPAAAVLSGALLASAAASARRRAARRELEGGGGLSLEEVLCALDEALAAEAAKLASPPVARQMLELPRAREITRVELRQRRGLPRHRVLRAIGA